MNNNVSCELILFFASHEAKSPWKEDREEAAVLLQAGNPHLPTRAFSGMTLHTMPK